MPRKKKEDTLPDGIGSENENAAENKESEGDPNDAPGENPIAECAREAEERAGESPESPAGDGFEESLRDEAEEEVATEAERMAENPVAEDTREAEVGAAEDFRDAESAAETGKTAKLGADAENGRDPKTTEDAEANVSDDDAMPSGDAIRDDSPPDVEETPSDSETPLPDVEETPSPRGDAETPPDAKDTALVSSANPPAPKRRQKIAPARKRTISDLDLNALDKDLSEEQMREWNALYASYRAKSVLTGTIAGADEIPFDVRNLETGETERRKMISLIVINYRVKVLIPESEVFMPGEERPSHVLRNAVGAETDYVVMEIDREGECAIASRRLALAAKRHFFAKGEHREGERMRCRVVAVGAKQCTVECNGFDIRLTQRDLSYAAMADLREKYRPGRELPCLLKSYDRKEGKLEISVKEVNPNPFSGADTRHPIGNRRQAVISGKYGGGVFCTLPDDTVCLCLYSAGHSDADFAPGDSVIIAIRQYDFARKLIYGRILAKW
jgi:hypothetical protein